MSRPQVPRTWGFPPDDQRAQQARWAAAGTDGGGQGSLDPRGGLTVHPWISVGYVVGLALRAGAVVGLALLVGGGAR